MLKQQIGIDPFVWWIGVVEDRRDPLFLGRAKVRIVGWHTSDKTVMPTENLPWAEPIMPIDHGKNPVGVREGDYVVGFFKDSVQMQEPVMIGVLPGIPETPANPELGFNDPTPDDLLTPSNIPRPPEFSAPIPFAQKMTSGIEKSVSSGLEEFTRRNVKDIPELKGLYETLPSMTFNDKFNLTRMLIQEPRGFLTNVKTNGIEEVFKSFQVNDILNQSPSQKLSVFNAVGSLMNKFSAETNTLVAGLSQNSQFQNFITSISGKDSIVRQFVDDSGRMVSSVLTGANEVYNYITDEVGNIVTQGVQFVQDATGQIVEESLDLVSPITNQITDSINSFVTERASKDFNISDTFSIGNFTYGVRNDFITGMESSIEKHLSGFFRAKIPNEIEGAIFNLFPQGVLKSLTSNEKVNVFQFFNTDIKTNLENFASEIIPLDQLNVIIDSLGDAAKEFLEFLGFDTTELFGEEDPTDLESKFKNPDELPIVGTSVGVLKKEYDPAEYPYDINKDGIYNEADASVLAATSRTEGFVDTSGEGVSTGYPISRYPLEPYLNEPTTSRLARNENIESTIIAKKKGSVESFPTASFQTTGLGKDSSNEGDNFTEAETPYNAKYPYNKVFESESGHFIEIDDSPTAERLHWYHRSGTFREIYPDGTLVDKCVSKQYNITIDDLFVASQKNINVTSTETMRLKSGPSTVIESGGSILEQSGGNLSQNVGANYHRLIAEDEHIKVGGNANEEIKKEYTLKVRQNFLSQIDQNHDHIVKQNSYTLIEGTKTEVVEGFKEEKIRDSFNTFVKDNRKIKVDGDYELHVGGNLTIKCDGIIHMSSNAAMKLSALGFISTSTLLDVRNATIGGNNIKLNFFSDEIYAIPLFQKLPIPDPGLGIFHFGEPEASEDKVFPPEEPEPETPKQSSVKPGFVLDGYQINWLYKPSSDSNGKPVTLSNPGSGQHYFREAIPTGKLETVTVEYLNEDLTITQWEVVRPVHKPGKIIEKGVFSGIGNGGRAHYRYSKKASEYPKQMFLTSDDGTEWLILDSGIRHD